MAPNGQHWPEHGRFQATQRLSAVPIHADAVRKGIEGESAKAPINISTGPSTSQAVG